MSGTVIMETITATFILSKMLRIIFSVYRNVGKKSHVIEDFIWAQSRSEKLKPHRLLTYLLTYLLNGEESFLRS
jgi:hypothetical protein